MAVKKLSEKQKAFCREYLKDYNATQAYIRAGYTNSKHSHIYVYKLLQNIYIQEKLAELTKKQAEKAEVSIEWIIGELKGMYEKCQSDLRSPGIMANATRQLELLGKHLAMFTDKFQVKDDDLHITVSYKNKKK